MEIKTLENIMELLSKLNLLADTKEEKALVLEIGYLIKQEMNAMKDRDIIRRYEGQILDPKKLLEDNKSLYNENQMLIASIRKMESIVNDKIPSIQHSMEKFNTNLKYLIEKCK